MLVDCHSLKPADRIRARHMADRATLHLRHLERRRREMEALIGEVRALADRTPYYLRGLNALLAGAGLGVGSEVDLGGDLFRVGAVEAEYLGAAPEDDDAALAGEPANQAPAGDRS